MSLGRLASSWLRAPALAGVFVAALLLGGCATPQVAALDHDWPADLPARAELHGVPFFAQEDHQCGPAALAMVAQAAGVSVTPEALLPQVYLPGRQGSLQLEMLAASRRQGLPGYLLAPRLDSLLREVGAGHPVLVLQNLAFGFAPVWHYAVVIGFDRERNELTLHSGRTERLVMSLFTFERTWARADHWAMLALPPTQLPATAEAGAYVGAVAALERVHPAAARTAYATALAAWPDERGALLGAGNAAHALGRLDEAVAAFRHATVRQPDFADAWNNLAQVLLEQGHPDAAAQAVAKAVALGGPRLARYRELQHRIQAR